MGRKRYVIEEKAEKLFDELRLTVRRLVREFVRVVDWLVKPSKNMADVLEKIAFLLLAASIIFRSRGW